MPTTYKLIGLVKDNYSVQLSSTNILVNSKMASYNIRT